MSTVRVGEITFKIYPQDHHPRHVHAFVGSGEVIIDLHEDGTVRFANRAGGPIRGHITRSETRKVLVAAASAFDRLAQAWDKMHK